MGENRKCLEYWKSYRRTQGIKKITIEEAKNIEEYKERVNKAINKYPKETEAYCRGWAMITNNYSERAILETAKKILKDEL